MINKLTEYYSKKPLQTILLVGLLLRVIAALTAHGYYAYDDHYKVVAIAWDWTQGLDSDNWFVDDFSKNSQLRTIYYPGIVALILKTCYVLGVSDNFHAMTVVQLFHAAFSLLIIYYSYKITQKTSDEKTAKVVGWINAAMWLFPFLSVRTLIEWTCIPPMFAAFWVFYKKEEQPSLKEFFWIGLLLGISFTLRFQTSFITLGFGLVILFRSNIKGFLSLSSGFLLLNIITQGITDYYVCNMPFGKLIEYINYNLEHSSDYISRPVFDYIILCPLLLLPPLGIYFFWGSFRDFKRHLPLFSGMFLFFIVHSVFENKQERFIFPILPFIVLLGSPWMVRFFKQRPLVKKWSLYFFLVANSYLLIMMTTNYTKKSKIEAMRFLSRQKIKPQMVLIENIDKKSYNAIPKFYFNKCLDQDTIYARRTLDSISREAIPYGTYLLSEIRPDETLSEERKQKLHDAFPRMVFKARICGSTIDNFRFKLNGAVKNYEYNIYYLPQ